eukprot:g75775.t1
MGWPAQQERFSTMPSTPAEVLREKVMEMLASEPYNNRMARLYARSHFFLRLLLSLAGLFRKSNEISEIDLRRFGLDPMATRFVSNVCSSAALYSAVLAALTELQLLNESGMGTLTKYLGIALGFASQEALANFAGGIMLLVTRPFGVGDYIKVPGLQVCGWVLQVGMMSTILNSADHRRIVLPNQNLIKNHIVNLSKLTAAKAQVKLLTARDADIQQCQQLFNQVLQQVHQRHQQQLARKQQSCNQAASADCPQEVSDRIHGPGRAPHTVPDPQVFVKGCDKGSLEWELSLWCHRDDETPVVHEILAGAHQALIRHQIPLPKP